MQRREALKTVALAAATTRLSAAATPPRLPQAMVDAHDRGVDETIAKQELTPGHRHRGNIRSADSLFWGGSPGGILSTLSTAYLLPQSRHYRKPLVLERIKLAAECFSRIQTPDGNWNLPITNFNSPPDTSFIIQGLGQTLLNARQYGFPELEPLVEPAVKKAGEALLRGGVHTPNHRWVVCSALALLNELYPDPRYLKRIDQWLAESIDIDAEGQYTERSSIGYNGICNRALTICAHFLKRPELLNPVRQNLQAMLYLIHADGEVVTEISRRQDLNQRGTMFNSWLGIAYLAWKDRDGQMAGLARSVQSQGAGVAAYLNYPQLLDSELPPSKPLPDNYEKLMPITGIARVRRGKMSVSILRGRDRFFTFRHGSAVVTAVRFSSAFFGKGQFLGETMEKKDGSFVLTQRLKAGYYQPFEPTRQVTTDTYDDTREERRQTEVCHLESVAELTETPKGFRLRIRATGTDEIPLTVEINLREGGVITGAEKHPKFADSWVLRQGHATYSLGQDKIRIGPGSAPHTYLEVRGALPKLPGPCLFITAITPVDQVIEFERLS
jgi:hypothetical protein